MARGRKRGGRVIGNLLARLSSADDTLYHKRVNASHPVVLRQPFITALIGWAIASLNGFSPLPYFFDRLTALE